MFVKRKNYMKEMRAPKLNTYNFIRISLQNVKYTKSHSTAMGNKKTIANKS